MAELRAFRGLRYRPIDPPGSVIAPPYDVISPRQQDALYESSPYNVIRLEYPREEGEARYAAAARALAAWRGPETSALVAERTPALYLYEQEFEHGGHTYRRRSVLGRVRLTPIESGIIRPHEFTMARPKADRLALLRATRTNISPIYSLVDDAAGRFAAAVATVNDTPSVDAADITGQRHRLTPITDSGQIAAIAAAVRDRPLYIADGHHRYETALTYQEERRQASSGWTGEEPENFVLMAVSAAADPGLLILPIHRLLRRTPPPDARSQLEALFNVRDAGAADAAADRAALVQAIAAPGNTGSAFGAVGLQPGRLHQLVLRDRAAVERLMPAEHSAAWKALDVNVLQYGVLEPLFGITAAELTAGEVEFSEDAEETYAAVHDGRARCAFLVNATRPEEIVAVADAGDRMPQKSTYFYPKLGTGLVLNAHDLE